MKAGSSSLTWGNKSTFRGGWSKSSHHWTLLLGHTQVTSKNEKMRRYLRGLPETSELGCTAAAAWGQVLGPTGRAWGWDLTFTRAPRLWPVKSPELQACRPGWASESVGCTEHPVRLLSLFPRSHQPHALDAGQEGQTRTRMERWALRLKEYCRGRSRESREENWAN